MSKARKIIGTTIRSVLIILFAVIIAVVNTILPNYARMMDSMIVTSKPAFFFSFVLFLW